jgi:hypothetical protein
MDGTNADRMYRATQTERDASIVLNPSARVLWRSADSVQVELGSRAIIVEGVDSALIRALTEPDAARVGPPAGPPDGTLAGPPGLDDALSALAANGFAWRRAGPRTAATSSPASPASSASPASPAPPASPASPASPRLAGELAALRARHGSRAEQVLANRAAAAVVVHGTGRLPVAVGALLAGANVGRVTIYDSGEVHRHDSAPGGLLATDEGRRFNEAAHDAIRRAAPGVDTTSIGPSERPDLVVLAGVAPIGPELRQRLHAEGTAHLSCRTGADEAVVGPLVLPGLTSCLACADLTRLDRDPAWSMLAVQLCTPRPHAGPSDLALMNLTASIAALQALAYLDGEEPTTLSATLELILPDWRVRRRSWRPHHDCECGATPTERAQ